MPKPKKPRPNKPQVSIKGETYDKLREHCTKEGIPISHFVDQLCQDFLKDKKGNNR
jgi:hypothetical protein